MTFDLFGKQAAAELAAFKASARVIDEARQAEIQRLGSLLQSTIMKLLAVTDRDAHRAIRFAEDPEPKVQQASPSSGFLRRDSTASALRKSKEAASVVPA